MSMQQQEVAEKDPRAGAQRRRARGDPYRRVHVIINPASGQDRPILNTLNTVFRRDEIEWDVSITHKAGDAHQAAQDAVAAGVDAVAVYGGDGTVTEAAGGVMGSRVPLAILPGGTANALALALSIPAGLLEAAALINDPHSEISSLDMGQVDDRYFLVAAGVGIPGALARADRSDKDRLGTLAYIVQSMQAARETPVSRYTIRLAGGPDGDTTIEAEGIACLVANSGHFGLPGLSLAPSIVMDDGQLDVIVMRRADLESIVSLASTVVRGVEFESSFDHWQASEIHVDADPPQEIQVDGEVYDPGPIHVQLIQQALDVIVPAAEP